MINDDDFSDGQGSANQNPINFLGKGLDPFTNVPRSIPLTLERPQILLNTMFLSTANRDRGRKQRLCSEDNLLTHKIPKLAATLFPARKTLQTVLTTSEIEGSSNGGFFQLMARSSRRLHGSSRVNTQLLQHAAPQIIRNRYEPGNADINSNWGIS
jgi:hypothetical protein